MFGGSTILIELAISLLSSQFVLMCPDIVSDHTVDGNGTVIISSPSVVKIKSTRVAALTEVGKSNVTIIPRETLFKKYMGHGNFVINTTYCSLNLTVLNQLHLFSSEKNEAILAYTAGGSNVSAFFTTSQESRSFDALLERLNTVTDLFVAIFEFEFEESVTMQVNFEIDGYNQTAKVELHQDPIYAIQLFPFQRRSENVNVTGYIVAASSTTNLKSLQCEIKPHPENRYWKIAEQIDLSHSQVKIAYDGRSYVHFGKEFNLNDDVKSLNSLLFFYKVKCAGSTTESIGYFLPSSSDISIPIESAKFTVDEGNCQNDTYNGYTGKTCYLTRSKTTLNATFDFGYSYPILGFFILQSSGNVNGTYKFYESSLNDQPYLVEKQHNYDFSRFKEDEATRYRNVRFVSYEQEANARVRQFLADSRPFALRISSGEPRTDSAVQWQNWYLKGSKDIELIQHPWIKTQDIIVEKKILGKPDVSFNTSLINNTFDQSGYNTFTIKERSLVTNQFDIEHLTKSTFSLTTAGWPIALGENPLMPNDDLSYTFKYQITGGDLLQMWLRYGPRAFTMYEITVTSDLLVLVVHVSKNSSVSGTSLKLTTTNHGRGYLHTYKSVNTTEITTMAEATTTSQATTTTFDTTVVSTSPTASDSITPQPTTTKQPSLEDVMLDVSVCETSAKWCILNVSILSKGLPTCYLTYGGTKLIAAINCGSNKYYCNSENFNIFLTVEMPNDVTSFKLQCSNGSKFIEKTSVIELSRYSDIDVEVSYVQQESTNVSIVYQKMMNVRDLYVAIKNYDTFDESDYTYFPHVVCKNSQKCSFPNHIYSNSYGRQELCLLYFNLKSIHRNCKTLILPSLTVKSMKLQHHQKSKLVLFDSLYKVSLSVAFPNIPQEVISYNWEDATGTNTKIFECKSSCMKTFSGRNSTHVVTVNASGVTVFPVSVSSKFELYEGINVTFHVNKAQQLNTTSAFKINIWSLGFNPCLFFNVDDPTFNKQYGFYDKSDVGAQSRCLSKAPSTLNIIWHAIPISSQISRNVTIHHTYQKEGVYNATFVAVNIVHDQNITIPINVLSVQCETPEVTLEGLGISDQLPVTYFRSEGFIVESFSKVNCNESAVTTTSWNIYHGDELREECLSDEIVTKNVVTLRITPRSLSYGMFRICVILTMKANEHFQSEKCGYLLITYSELFASLAGGIGVRRAAQMEYEIDASFSMDLDTGNTEEVEFYYFCRAKEDPEFNVSRENIQKIPFAVPSYQESNRGGCFGTGAGRLIADTNATKVKIPAGLFLMDKELEILLFIWKGSPSPNSRSAFFKQKLKMLAGNPPSVSIKCLANCGTHISHSKVHSFEGVCDDETACVGQLQFLWILFKCSDKNAEDCTEVSPDQFDKIITTEQRTMYYSAKEKSYNASQWYKLTFRSYRGNVYGETNTIFYVNLPPMKGRCTIDKNSGIVFSDKYKITCRDWTDKDLPLHYKYYTYQNGVQQIFYAGFLSEFSVFLPLGLKKENYSLLLHMAISDRFESEAVVNTSVQVLPPKDTADVVNAMLISNQDNESEINVYAQSGDIAKLSNTILLFSSILNADKDQVNRANLTETEKQKKLNESLGALQLRESFVNKLASVDVSDAQGAIKMLGTFSSVASKPFELSNTAQSDIISKCDDIVTLFNNVSTEDKLELAKGVYNAMSKVMEISSSIADVNNLNNSKNDAVLHACPDKEKCKKESIANINRTKSAIKRLNSLFLKSIIPSAEPVVFEGDTIGFAIGKFLSSSHAIKIGAKGSTISISNFSRLISNNSENSVESEKDFVSIEVVSYGTNIYTFDESAVNVKSTLTGVDISSKDGTPIEVNSELEISVVNIPVKKNISENQAQVKPNGEQWAFHTVAIRNTSFRSKIKTENDSHLITYVYLRKDKRPTEDIYDYKWKLPDNSSCRWLNETLHADEDIVIGSSNKSQYYCTRDDNAVFVSDKDDLYGTYYLGIQYIPIKAGVFTDIAKKRKRRSDEKIDLSRVDQEFCVAISPSPPTPAPTGPPGTWVVVPSTISNNSVKYTLEITIAKCLFWNETEEKWSSNGCTVGPETTPEVTQCLCNHLTDFGGDVLVAPNPIDFDKVFEGLANLADNLGVLMVILSILLLYVLLVMWARKKDTKDEEERQPIVIDCSRGSLTAHSYLVTIVTGAGTNAGTSANVYLRISGSICDSNIIPLKSDVRKMFQSRSATTVKVILPTAIGDVDYVRIFHDNSGKSPSWYLRNIIITDLSCKKQYPFVYDSWLAVESDDGQIEALLSVASDKELAGFHIVFKSTAAKSLLDGHIWFSIFTRPKQSTFTRVQRLSCCLCLIFLTMITNAMFFGAGDAGSKTTIRLGNVVIDITGIIIGIEASLIVIPPSMLVIEIFRRLKPKATKRKLEKSHESGLEGVEDLEDYEQALRDQNISLDAKKKQEKGSFLFPHNFKYLAYGVIGFSSSGSALFTFFYSMMWGPEKSNEWLTSMFTGFFQSVLIIQPVKAVFMAILFALILRKPIKQDHVLYDDQEKEKKKDKEGSERDIDGDDDIISADEIPIVRPTESALERARKRKLKEKMTGQVIKDIATYAVFLAVVVFLAYSEKDVNTYYMRKDMANLFVRSRYVKGPSLQLVSNPGYFYSWLRDTLVPSIFIGPWYNDDLPESYRFLDNRESILIGIPRLRQQRVQRDSCTLATHVRHVISECFDAYSVGKEDHETYEAGWKHVNTTKRSKRDTGWIVQEGSLVAKKRVRRYTNSKYVVMKVGKGNTLRRRTSLKNAGSMYYVVPAALHPDGTVISCGDRWKHFTAKELRGFPFWGKLGTYSGGGYIANLGYNEETAWTVMADLHAHNWLDRQTRAVFVEFTVYNANVNLFATAFLFMEILPTGGGFPHSDFKVFNGYRYALNSHIASRIIEAVFVFFIIYFTAREIRKLVKQRLSYFKSFFNMIEVFLFPLNITMFGLIIFRWLSTAKNIRQFKENPKDYVSFQYSAEADSALQAVIGVIVFLLNIKFLKYFQFSKSFYQVGLIMKSFFKPLVSFCVSFFIFFLTFAAAAHLSFGAVSENYQTFTRTIVTQFLHLLGGTDYEEAKNASNYLGPLYYVTYSLLVMFITFNVFLAIICNAIDEDFEEEFKKNLGDIHVIEYLVKAFTDIIGFENHEATDDSLSNTCQNYEAMDKEMKRLEEAVAKLDALIDSDFEKLPSTEELQLKHIEEIRNVAVESQHEIELIRCFSYTE